MPILQNITLPNQVLTVINRIMSNGGQVYIVGGALREILLGKEPKDWDIATSLHPEQVEEMFSDARTVPTGKKFGTITVIINNTPIEITTFRGEGKYSDFRHPDEIRFVGDIVSDLSRRDFTINAMAFNPYLGDSVIDPFGGAIDLNNGILRAVGFPQKRFSEDPLRMLRGIRFVSQLGFSIEDKTLDAVRDNSSLISLISVERVRDELTKTILGDHVLESFALLCDTGILKIILPELYQYFKKDSQCFKTMEYNSVTITAKCNEDLILRLAALFSGIRRSGTPDPAQLTEKAMSRLRYDKKTTRQVIQLLSTLDICFSHNKQRASYQIRKLLGNLGVDNTLRLIELKSADVLAQPDGNPEEKLDKLNEIKKLALQTIIKGEPIRLSDLAVDGNDILKEGIGRYDKREVGKALNMAYEWVLLNPSWNKKDLLLRKLKEVYKNSL